MSFLLDTNIVSEMRKSQANLNVRQWISSVSESELFISVLVIGELRQGIERLQRRDPIQAQLLQIWAANFRRTYRDRILPITTDISDEWGRLNVPDPAPIIDGLMAATAIIHNLTFVTRNATHVRKTGVRWFNPFED
jgi:toxin FitB